MPYANVRPNGDGSIPVSVSTDGGQPMINAGQFAMDAAAGIAYVGLNSGGAAVLPRALGFVQIMVITAAQYEALEPKDPRTLYIVAG
jgi:hypothetical protein